jgi:ABC-2 type transport system ATP-binding protein
MVIEGQSIIKLENVAVKYRVPEERFSSFKEYIVLLLQNRIKMKDFWALREINLDIQVGEVFGIIGRNGAGKTTLLKVISRVLSPSCGRILIGGEVVPLLELGAGFHPELTGRENVFLNGALLGHTQSEIKTHLSEMLDFAQIDGYIDAPIRTYSSGMIARLGFAVATSWEPEILVLDEVLAVGDEAFRAKCFLRIKQFRERGATIIIISHDMKTIQVQCDRALWLDQGSIQAIGEVKEVIAAYRKSNV